MFCSHRWWFGRGVHGENALDAKEMELETTFHTISLDVFLCETTSLLLCSLLDAWCKGEDSWRTPNNMVSDFFLP